MNYQFYNKLLKHPTSIGQILTTPTLLIYISFLYFFDNQSLNNFSFLFFFVLFILIQVFFYFGFSKLLSGKWNLKKWKKSLIVGYIIPGSILCSYITISVEKYSYIGSIIYLSGFLFLIGLLNRKIIIIIGLFFVSCTLFWIVFLDASWNNYKDIILFSCCKIIFIYFASNISEVSLKQNHAIRGLLRSSRKDKRNIIEEQQKSEKLLLNILPTSIADELKNSGQTKPKYYDLVTVMFTDFAGFTNIAQSLSAKELVDELDKCFSYFDSVTKKYKLEKIKTIGDSYMTCGGIPKENNTHPIDTVLAAIEIQSFMNQMKQIKENQNLPYWELRLGINTGPLVAGVIGEMKFAYDVFGDTVNTASRMESSGVNGKINISKATHELIKEFFDCEYRGKVAAKNKGMIDMYFVNRIKSELSVNGENRVPNDKFHKMYKELEKA
jgi:class 3 adenylate cyclase